MSVIVPVNPAGSEAALSAAISLAQERDYKLVAVLRRPISEFDQENVDIEIDELTDKLEAADIAFKIEVCLGNAEIADHIIDLATTHQASMIVVSLDQRPASGKLILGNQIQKLLVDSTCDVLIVRNN